MTKPGNVVWLFPTSEADEQIGRAPPILNSMETQA